MSEGLSRTVRAWCAGIALAILAGPPVVEVRSYP
jgi:hypothetical protein